MFHAWLLITSQRAGYLRQSTRGHGDLTRETRSSESPGGRADEIMKLGMGYGDEKGEVESALVEFTKFWPFEEPVSLSNVLFSMKPPLGKRS